MTQLTFGFATMQGKRLPVRDFFSHNEICAQEARVALEQQYGHLLEETQKFNRQLVSFQANKTERLHSWIKYREGFSAALVEKLLREFGVEPGDTILDPFAGSCTTLLVGQMLGVNSVGIELLPNCHLAWEAKSRVNKYDLEELRYAQRLFELGTPPKPADTGFPHLVITQSAFPRQTELDVMTYGTWIETMEIGEDTRILCRLVLTSVLEEVSYTRKDGQYLRWDARAKKIRRRNERRQEQGKKLIKGIDKGALPTVKQAFEAALQKVLDDVAELQRDDSPLPSNNRLIRGNTLTTLPTLEADQFTTVITSPPYANRYDYTRTYALELAYLGTGDDIFQLRQRQLSCTVENKSKLSELEQFYRALGHYGRFQQVVEVLENSAALAEVNAALQARSERGEINNRGVLPMIEQYFTELTFVYAELYRTCKAGAYVAFVNDNVRYAGEIIPVDLLSTELAAGVGFEPYRVYVLPQRKGNSSQQMSRFGRAPLRKSITIWRKP